MIIDKLYWKTLYYWIRYLNYDLLSSEKDNNEIWLVHKRKKSVVVFRRDVTTSQEIRFDKSKVKENFNQLEQTIGFKPKSFNFYYFTDKDFLEEKIMRVIL